MYPDVIVDGLVVGECERTESTNTPPIHTLFLVLANGILVMELYEPEHNPLVVITNHLGIGGERLAVGFNKDTCDVFGMDAREKALHS